MATQALRLQTPGDNRHGLAFGLGLFSLGLGAAEVAMPQRLARFIGFRGGNPNLIRGLGMREIAAGVGILAKRNPSEFLWSRVAGDAMDLAFLGLGIASNRRGRNRSIAATAAVAGVTALDIFTAWQLTRQGASNAAVLMHKAITVNRSSEELYSFWRNFQNLPRFMPHLESVRNMADNRSHWKAKAIAGKTVEWDAEIVEDVPNSRIGWRSVEGSDIRNSGCVRFDRATGARGTVVRVEMHYDPPGGALAATAAKLFGKEPGQMVEDALRAFKQIMETGELTRSDASIHPGMHAAQPPSPTERTMTAR